MFVKIVAYLTNPATIAVARKLGSVWLFSFVAASGGIFARRWHRDTGPQQQPPTRQRPWQGPNLWRRRP